MFERKTYLMSEVCSQEIFNHTGVALKKKNSDESFDPVPGILSIVQYEVC